MNLLLLSVYKHNLFQDVLKYEFDDKRMETSSFSQNAS